MATTKKAEGTHLVIQPPKFEYAVFTVEGISPLVMNKFSKKAMEQIKATQEAGSRAKSKKKREARNFDESYEGALHISTDGWYGIPCAAFRNACISACRIAGFVMTRAKLSIFCEPDGFDEEGTGLVKITKGRPKQHMAYGRNDNGSVDLRIRPMWDPGWKADVRLRWDGDQFTVEDVSNLLSRVGMQVGICEGRPDSKNSAGMGWGLFKIAEK